MSEARKEFMEWLEIGKSQADELEAKKPPQKRKQKGTVGSNVSWRKRDMEGQIFPKHVRKSRSVKASSTKELQELEQWQPDEILQEVPSLDQHLQKLKTLLSTVIAPASAEVEEASTISAWTRRQVLSGQKFRAALPDLVNSTLAAEMVTRNICDHCSSRDAVIRCLDCVPSGTSFVCGTCDEVVHKRQVFHNREATFEGFYKPIAPTTIVVLDEHVCLLPIPPPKQICSCGPSTNVTITPGKQTVVVTINGTYNLCLPAASCRVCSGKWTPGTNDLLRYRYWPATSSCQMMFTFDVLTSFQQMKLASPALSQQAFLKMLEHRSLSTGWIGGICGDTFHRACREFSFCQFKKDDLCQGEPFKCPACTPDMLAISVDGNRKHYRYSKSKGTDEPSLFEGLFMAEDTRVSAFVDQLKSHMRSGHDGCGPATFTAGREASTKSRAKVDEEGLETSQSSAAFSLFTNFYLQ